MPEPEANAGTPPPPAEGAPEATAPAALSATEVPTEVSVVGTRLSQTPGSAHVIKRKQLERFEYDDPHAVLATVPGVYARGEDGLGLRPNIGIRGVNPDRSKKLTLMEDGILFAPAPYSAPAAYFFPLITRMTAVRVIKGPAAVSYGPQTVGGAIDLVTRPVPSAASTGGVDLAAGEYGYAKAHAYFGASDERFGFLVEGVHLRNDGFKRLPNGGDTGSYRNEWMVKGSYVIDPKAKVRQELRLKATYSDEVSNETYLGLTDADFKADPLQRYEASALDRMEWHRTGLALTYLVEPASGVTVTTTAYRNDLARVWRKVNRFRGVDLFGVLRDPNDARNAIYHGVLKGQADSSSPGETLLIGPNDRDFVAQGIESRIRWDTHTGPISHRLEYGLRLHHDRVERRQSEDPFLLIGGRPVPEGGPTVVTAFNEASATALAMHATDALGWGALTLTPGARVEAIHLSYKDRATGDETGRSLQVVLPGVGAYYALWPSLGVLAGVHRGFSPPAPGTADSVKPEFSVNYEGGARFSKGALRVEAVGFYNDYSNLTDVCTLSSGCVEQNLDRQFDAGSARIYGLEAYAEHEVPIVGSLKLPFSVAYTLTRAEFRRTFRSDDPIFGDVTAGDEMPYVPRHQAYASLGLESNRAGGSVGVTYVASMREVAGSGAVSSALHTDEQFMLDLSAYLRVFGPFMVYANGRNLLDSNYIVSRRPYGARPNAPRWLQVGLKASF
ncbi:MAG: TonB-dependent receptor [Polyangiaceae bacterium]|nr:TonB-dependent receptor [Polyangiaceae bacterium]